MKTVLITGCSSGYGLETARHFLAQGWRVIATMRTPRQELLPASANLRILALDVTQPGSIARALDAAGPIDVLVNNAGIGLFGAFEATPMATVRDIFETNTFGANRMKLRSFGLGDQVRAINLAGAEIARRAVANAKGDAYVAGAIGPLGVRVEPWGKTGVDEAEAMFRDQAQALVDGKDVRITADPDPSRGSCRRRDEPAAGAGGDRWSGPRSYANCPGVGRSRARRRQPRLSPPASDRAQPRAAGPLRRVRRCGDRAPGPRPVARPRPLQRARGDRPADERSDPAFE